MAVKANVWPLTGHDLANLTIDGLKYLIIGGFFLINLQQINNRHRNFASNLFFLKS